MDFLQPLQETAIAKFVGESGSLLGYPTVLFLHTIGLATVAGLAVRPPAHPRWGARWPRRRAPCAG